MFQDLLNKLKEKRFSRGYSLTELMIAILMFGIVAVSISLPLSNSIYANVNNKNLTTANTLAKNYLKAIEDEWKIQADYDTGALPEIDSTYTDNGTFAVSVSITPLETDSDGVTVILRRVNIIYKTSDDSNLCDLYYDYNRPASM